MKVLAIDYGRKRIGFASGDSVNKIAFPCSVIENKNFAYVSKEISDFCRKWEVKLIVVGMPYNMEGEGENKMTGEIQALVKKLKRVLQGVELAVFDERLSSFEADEVMRKAGKSTRENKDYQDAFAAQIILQRFFDTLEN